MLRALLALAVIASLTVPASTQAKGKRAKHRVVLAPLSTLGTEAKSSTIKGIERSLATELSQVPGFTLIGDADLDAALKTARQPELRVCDGEARCLSALGALVAANYTVFGEVGGLGDAQIVYLKLVDVKQQRIVRTTTLELTGTADDVLHTRAATIRLLSPGRYVGTVVVNVDAAGAGVYVDGERVARSPSKPLRLSVGSHALRVTHPEYRDFVRFLEVGFGKTETVAVNLQQFPIVASEIRREGGDPVANVPAAGVARGPWYTEWYTIVGASTVLAVGTAVIVGVVAGGISFDDKKTVEPPTAP